MPTCKVRVFLQQCWPNADAGTITDSPRFQVLTGAEPRLLHAKDALVIQVILCINNKTIKI